jgi:hypothetical protein
MTPERRPEEEGPDSHSEREGRDRLGLEAITLIAREVALRDGGHVPTIIAQGSAGSLVGQLPDMPDTHEGKVGLMHLVGTVFGQSGEVGSLSEAFFISEGWMSQPGPEGIGETLPSQDPNRIEILVISRLIVEKKRSDLVILEMVRDDAGQLSDLKELHSSVGEDTQVGSPLLDAFVEGFRASQYSNN